jgi:hypothetical protein
MAFFVTCSYLITTVPAAQSSSASLYRNEFVVPKGHRIRNSFHSPLPYTYISEDDLPEEFSWANVNGTSYLTHSLNQRTYVLIHLETAN